jgi:hypothetical protein
MSSITIPPKRPGAPTTVPPPDDFDEEAPTAVVPGQRVPAGMPREFDPGGENDPDENAVTSDRLPAFVDPKDDDDTAPTKDS